MDEDKIVDDHDDDVVQHQRKRPSWLTLSNTFAFVALVISATTAHMTLRSTEDLSLGVFRFFAFTVNDLSSVSMDVSIANVGTDAAIVSQVRLIAPNSADFDDFTAIQWRELSINNTAPDKLSASREYIEPILIPSGGLVTKKANFMFNLMDLHQTPEGKIPLTLCVYVIDHSGQRVTIRAGEFAVYVVDGEIKQFDTVKYTRFQLLPKPKIVDKLATSCARH